MTAFPTDPIRGLHDIQTAKIVSLSGVPMVFAALLQVPRQGHDLSSLHRYTFLHEEAQA